MSEKKLLLPFLFCMILTSVVARLLPHPPNFAPIAALALFAGVYASRLSKWYLLAPIAAMLVSDVFVGFYEWEIMAAVYVSFFAVALIGVLLGKYKHAGTIVLGSLTGSMLFYLATNFAVWAFSGMYAPTLDGILLSYVMALPFFKFTLLGDLFYAGVFFGAYEGILRLFSLYKLAGQRII